MLNKVITLPGRGVLVDILSEASSLPPRDPNAKGLDTLGECLRTEPSFGSNSKIWCDSWGEVAL